MKRNNLLFVSALSAVILSGCSIGDFGDGGVEKNNSKTQLNISCWDGGHGVEWIDVVARKFEEIYKDHSFEEGKVGVQVWTSASKGNVYDSFANNILSDTSDISISEQCNYNGFVVKKSALDITDIVTTPLTEYGETRSIADKLSATDKDFYGCAEQNKYYGLPWYESLMGFQYDVDLFEENGYYFADNTGDVADFISRNNPTKGTGPDGVLGTDDDGLPRTYEEFFKLCDKIVSDGSIPFIWPGNAQNYINGLLSSLAADYDGYEQTTLQFTLNGTANGLIKSINGDNIEFESPTVINNSNGYLLKKQAGAYYGLKFIERLLTTTNESGGCKYYDKTICRSLTTSQKEAQSNFLRNKFRGDKAQPIAMLVDGSWWHAEASATFKALENTPGASAKERKISFLPLPKVDLDHLGPSTYYNSWMTSVNIRSNIETNKIPVAKQFMRYLHTDESLSAFTRVTSNVRPFSYSLTESDAAEATYYANQIMKIHNSNTADNPTIVMPWSRNNLVINNLADFMLTESKYTTLVEPESYSIVTNAFLASGLTAEQYFNGLSAKTNQATWNNSYSKFF